MPDEAMNALIGAAIQVMGHHEVDASGRCGRPECVLAGVAGRCLPYRLADWVVSGWANRRDLTLSATVGPDELDQAVSGLAPGQSLITPGPVQVLEANGQTRWFPPGTRVVRAVQGHPPWCAATACRLAQDQTHIGLPDVVANVMITLMQTEGEAPMIVLADLTEGLDEAGTLAVPVGYAPSFAQAVSALGRHATSADVTPLLTPRMDV